MRFFGLGRLFGLNSNSNSNDDLTKNNRTPEQIARNNAAANARRAANADKAAKLKEQYDEIARLKAEAKRAEENSKRARVVASKMHDVDEIEPFIMDTVPEKNETQDGGRRKLKSKKATSKKSKSKAAKSKKSRRRK